MDSVSQYRPHPKAAFEGYYSNFQLSDGSRIILIICTVRKANERPHMVSFTYCPSGYKSRHDVLQKEIWADSLEMSDQHSQNGDFSVDTPSGSLKFNRQFTEFQIDSDRLHFQARVDNSKRLEWLPGRHDTPEGVLALLPLPLHWQVYSLSSPAKLSWKLESRSEDGDIGGGQDQIAHVHLEKNWAISFPSAHTWIQARDTSKDGKLTSGVNVAGGHILGLHAYLMTYHSTNPVYSTSTRPPFSMLLFPFLLPTVINPTSLTTAEVIMYKSRTVHLEFLTSLFPLRKISIQASADPASFFPLHAPFPEGHRANFLVQSMRANITVKIFEIEEKFGFSMPFLTNKRLSFGTRWHCVHEDVFDNGGLEFGGEWYGDRG